MSVFVFRQNCLILYQQQLQYQNSLALKILKFDSEGI